MEEKVLFKSPPRLLLGVSFLFWGAMLEQPVAALAAAIIAESRHWTKIRWEFGEKGFARAWQLCMLILIVVAVSFLQSEERTAQDSLFLLSWLPFILMPVGLAQQYSSDQGVPLTTFSYFARRKLAADRRAGRPVHLRWFQFGYCWFGIILTTAGLGIGNSELLPYSIGVVLLVGIALYDLRGSRKRPGAWSAAYLMALVLAGGMTVGIYEVFNFVVSKTSRVGNDGESQRDTETAIGEIGKLQLSPKIEWRYFQDEGVQPALLRLAIYNKPVGSKKWISRGRSPKFIESKSVTEERDRGGAFLKMFQNEAGDYSYREEDLNKTSYTNRGRVIGLVEDQSLIPAPMKARRILNPRVEGMEHSTLGATRVFDPSHGALELQFESGGGSEVFEDDPSLFDLRLPTDEVPGLTRFLKGVGEPLTNWKSELDEQKRPTLALANRQSRAEQEVLLGMLSGVFASEEFSYTLMGLEQVRKKSPITYFLEVRKKGHCEYYASATAMLLRRAGIPSRYVVGYAVEEQGDDPGEWLLRGKHAHAWTQAYIGGKWVNEGTEKDPIWRCRNGEWVTVDNTPASWLNEGDDTDGFLQGLKDWMEIARQDIILWFSRPLVSLITKVVFGVLFVFLIVYLVYRLVVTKRNFGAGEARDWEEKCRSWNVLKDFERWLGKRVGARPQGEPMASWLSKHLEQDGDQLVTTYQRLVFDPVSRSDEKLLPELMGEVKRLKQLVRAKRT